MIRTWKIAENAFFELVRQPVYFILLASSVIFIFFLSNIYYFGFGEDPKMVKENALAVLFLSGLFCAVFGASNTISQEIRSGTALAVLSKPVGRMQFVLAKFLGVSAAVTLGALANILPLLLVSRLAFDVYGEPQIRPIIIFYVCVLLAFAVAGFTNYFLGRHFVMDGVFSLIFFVFIAFIIINFIDKHGDLQAFGSDIDWRLIGIAMLLIFALWMLSGLAVVCSTRFELVPSLAIVSGFFLLGLMSDYIFGQHLSTWWGKTFYTLLPNWQLLWMADALEEHKSVPLSYIFNSLLYTLAYLGAILGLSLILFEDRELH